VNEKIMIKYLLLSTAGGDLLVSAGYSPLSISAGRIW